MIFYLARDIVMTQFNGVRCDMLSKTVNGVTVEVTNKHNGRTLDLWIIVTIRVEGLPALRHREGSYASAEEAFDVGFRVGSGVLNNK